MLTHGGSTGSLIVRERSLSSRLDRIGDTQSKAGRYAKMKTMKIAVIAIIGVSIIGVYSLHAQDAAKSVWDGVYTEDQAKRGGAQYADQCASCHGDQLTGGEMAPPLAGGEFLSNWNGLSLGDLFERIRTGMPPSDPGKLSRDKKAEIVAYRLAFNKFPAGSKEMPAQTEMLKQVRIDAQKPEKK